LNVVKRRNKIIEILRLKRTISIQELSVILDVSEMTLYRDINKLDDTLFLSKGNVVYKNDNETEESPYHTRKLHNIDLKTAIARSAINYIDNNDTIFLDGSSTVGYLANELIRSDLNLTVVTISPIISIELAKKENIRILCPGGLMDKINMIYIADMEKLLNSININKAFLSCGAFSIDNGFTDMTQGEYTIKSKIIDDVSKINILVDHTKMNKSYSYTWSDISGPDRIIIDSSIDKGNLERLESKNVEIVLGNVEVF